MRLRRDEGLSLGRRPDEEAVPSRYVAGAQYAKYTWNNASEQLRLTRESTYLSVQDYIEWKSGKIENFTVRMFK